MFKGELSLFEGEERIVFRSVEASSLSSLSVVA